MNKMWTDVRIKTIKSNLWKIQKSYHKRNKFYANVEEYKNTLSLCMREKSMITISLHSNIIDALKQIKGGKKTGVDSKFFLWCKTHFKIDQSAGVEILCSSKNGNRIVVVDHYYQVRPLVFMRQSVIKTTTIVEKNEKTVV